MESLQTVRWSQAIPRAASGPPVFLPGGERFVLLEGDAHLSVVTRELISGRLVAESKHTERAADPVLSPDGRWLAARAGNQAVVFHGDNFAALPVVLENDTPKQFTGLAFHPSGGYMAATSNDATVKIYDTATWKVAKVFTWEVGRMRSIAFSPDGMLAAAGSDSGRIVVWDFDL